MNPRKFKKFASLLLVFILAFSLSSNVYAFEDSFVDPNDTNEILLSSDSDPEQIFTSENENTDVWEAVPAPRASAKSASTPLKITSVYVLNGGATQSLYRPEVYEGDAANGEDPEKYYTTRREINLKDPRVFSVEFEVAATGITVSDQEYLNTIEFKYGDQPLSAWTASKNLRDTTKKTIFTVVDKQISADSTSSVYTISAAVKFDTPYTTTAKANALTNVPHDNYIAGAQGDFGSGQTADNRAFFQFGPNMQGPGTYALEAVSNTTTLASTDLHIGPYDEYHSWTEINEFCQNLITSLTSNRVNLDNKPLGTLAKGNVTMDANGNFVAGGANDVYVEVSILGYGLTDNYAPGNGTFKNYSQFNAIWNIVVAKNATTVTDYLKPGGYKDQMNDNPKALIDKYKDSDAKDIDLVLPYYQNNVHSDEVSGTDSIIHVIEEMIEGGTAGKTISYKTFEQDKLDWNYRPSGNTNNGYSAFNHAVKANEFASDGTRISETIRTNDVLDKFIMVNTLCSNPDGKAAMRRVNRYGLDLNRDTVYATQPETIALTQDIAKWDPLMFLEWHGYVTQMLIEPCTAPHSLNYEPDLTLNNMIELAYAGGKALTGSTGYNRFHLPWDSMADGWDDGGNVYGPMYSMLFGAMGWTIEFPHSNSDSFDAGNAINYGMLNSLMNGKTSFYPGNVLNGSIDGKDSHAVDNKYTDLRKSTIMNKLEFKLRGIENIDSPSADKYFIEVVDGVEKYVGRVRKDDGKGGKLPFFPDYLVVPGTPENQFNVAEALRTLDFTMKYGAKVSQTTEPVAYNGVTYPAGTYLYDMKQGRRNLIAEIMSKGYDATSFASMYADIYCNFPDTRGFDCVEVWSPNLFDGKTSAVTQIEKRANIGGTPSDYIVFKSNSTDSVRFVNLLLSGRSSGPSTIATTKDVWMLRKSVNGVGTMSDYIIEASSLNYINSLKDNPDLGLKGCHIEGKYISQLPKEATKLVNPVISLNSTRNSATAGGAIYWALDDYLGFGSMKNADGTDYNGNTNSTVRPDANVVIVNGTTAAGGDVLSAIKNDKAALIMMQSAATLTDANFGTGNAAAPGRGSLADVALYGNYNVDDSIFTANYANTHTIYARGSYFKDNIPEGSKILFKSKDGGAFIGGYQKTKGDKEVFQNQTTMFSTLLKGGNISEKPAQSITFGGNVFYRPHYQKYYPIIATAIFAGAAGILDDQIDPVIEDVATSGSTVTVKATDSDSGISGYSLYTWNTSSRQFDFTSENTEGSFTVPAAYKIVATDYAGNEAAHTYGVPSGGSSGSSGTIKPVTPPTSGSTVKVDYKVSGSTASVDLPTAKVTEIIDGAKNKEAIIDLSKAAGVTSGELPKTALTSIQNSGLSATVKLPTGTMTLDKTALDSILKQTSGTNLKMEMKPVATNALTAAQKQKIKPNDSVIDISVLDGSKKISQFDGKVTIQVPYSGSLPAAVWYLDDNGNLEKLKSTYKNGVLSFTVSHLSLYVVGTDPDAWQNPFTDIKATDWFYGSVQFVNKNGLMNGTTANLFSPNATTTRGMVVTMLYRMSNSPAVSTSNLFSDVAAGQYYTDAVIWASENKIVSGYGNGVFAPNKAISREEMVTILMNYAKFKNYDVSSKADLSKFADASSISSWAADSMAWANAIGCIQGSNNMLMPSGNAERCQVASILKSFMEKYRN